MPDLREILRQRAMERAKGTPDEAFFVTQRENEAQQATGTRPCPICGEPMGIAAKGSIVLDVCDQHGVWLDQGELEKIVGHQARIHAIKCRAAIKAAEASGRGNAAAILALLALLDGAQEG